MIVRTLALLTAMLAGPTSAWPASQVPTEGRASTQPSPTAAPARWLIAPFEQVRGGPQERWIGEALAVLMTDALSAGGVPVYSPGDRREAWDSHGLSPSTALSRATLVAVGRAVAATHVVTGSYAVADGRIHITGRVLETAGPSLGPIVEEGGPLPDLVAVLGMVSGRLTGSSTPLTGPLSDHPPSAIEQFVRGWLASSAEARLSHFTQALVIAPLLHQAALEIWSERNEQDAHLAALAAARRVTGDSALARTAQLRAAVSLVALNRLYEARDQLVSLNRGERDAAVLNNLAIVDARLGYAGVDSITEAMRLAPTDADIRFNAGYAAWRRGEPAAAIAPLREAVRIRLDDAQAHYVLSQALAASGRPIEAAAEGELASRFSEELASLQPDAARDWERILVDPRGPGTARIDGALAAFRARAQDAIADSYRRIGREAMAQGRADAALGEFRRAAYLRPYDGVSYRLVAEASLAAGRAAEAVDAATLAVFGADDVASHLTLANALERAGHRSAARAEWERVLTRDPGNEAARRFLGLE